VQGLCAGGLARSPDGAKRNPGLFFAGFPGLRCAPSGLRKGCKPSSRTCECIPIPVLKTSLILLASCLMRGRFLEAISQRTERKLAEPGRPGTVDGLVAGGALGGAAPCLGRARCLAARGGFKGAHWCPGASHRSIPSRGSRGTGKPRTHCAARTRKVGCLKCEFGNFREGADIHSMSSRRTPGPIPSVVMMRKLSATCGNNSSNNNHRWLWVPAFAGTTRTTTPSHWKTRTNSRASCSHPKSACV
jgi:hypothetical protein